ncbi:MAG: hypothetical protein WCS96_06315 [Victivallales bacterium]
MKIKNPINTRYQKALKAMHNAEDRHPQSFVAVDPDSGRIVAHSRKLSEIKKTISTRKSSAELIISKKLPEKYHGYFNLSV